MIHLLVMYDVTANRIRNKIVGICLDYGLDRHQYSVFTGRLKPRQYHALARELARQTEDDGYVLVVPVAADDWQRRIEMGVPLHG